MTERIYGLWGRLRDQFVNWCWRLWNLHDYIALCVDGIGNVKWVSAAGEISIVMKKFLHLKEEAVMGQEK